MKKVLCLLLSLLFTLCSCGRPESKPESKTSQLTEAPAKTAAVPKNTEPETEAEILPDNVREEDGVYIFENDEYSIKFPKGFSASFNNGKLTLCPKDGKARYVTVEKTELDFSQRLSSKETAEAVAASLSGTLDGDPEKIELGGLYCVKFRFTSGDVRLTGYVFDLDEKVYIMCAASEDRDDDLSVRIAQTIKFSKKEITP